MNTMEKSKKDEKAAVQTGEGCCGGPAPEGVSACCVKDAEAKASGQEGCGCVDSQVQADAQPSACCGETSGPARNNVSGPSSAASNDSVRQAVRGQYGRVAAGAAGCGSGQGCCDAPMADASTVSQRLGYSTEKECGSLFFVVCPLC